MRNNFVLWIAVFLLVAFFIAGTKAAPSALPHKAISLRESIERRLSNTLPAVGIPSPSSDSDGGGKKPSRDDTRMEQLAKQLTLRRQKIAVIVLAVVFLTVLWNIVDANMTLFVYDLITVLPTRYARMHNRTVWVTGASSGIGAELVCQLTRANARHVVLSSRRDSALQAVIQDCHGRYPSSTTTFSVVPYDAAATVQYTQIVKDALKSTPDHAIDVLILNAGIYQASPSLETSLQDDLTIWNVNFVSPVQLCKTLLQVDPWKERGHGHIITISSVAGRGSHALASSYAASKHALRGFFHSLAVEEGDWLRVDLVLPGATDTNIWSTNFESPVRVHDSVKLSVQRCAQLILKGSSGPHWLFYETWISKQPGLIWIYLAAYTPDVFHPFIRLLGRLRMKQYRKEGGNADPLHLPSLLRHWFAS